MSACGLRNAVKLRAEPILCWDYGCVVAQDLKPLDRAVGLMGIGIPCANLEVRGNLLEKMEVGKRYRITIEEIP